MSSKASYVVSLLLCLILSVSSQTQSDITITIIAEGLFNPVGLGLLPDGGILIAEEGTGNRDMSAGISLLTSDGELGRLISGFPSSRDSGDLSGVPLVGVSPDGNTIYVGGFNGQQLYTLPSSEAQTLPDVPFSPDDLDAAMVRLNNVFLLNPFDITFDNDGIPVVTDATGNGVAKELPTGDTRFIHRFDELEDPVKSNQMIEAVPTGITRIDDEYYVTLTGGCPYPAKGGELVAIDEQRNQRTVVDNLNMPIDVEVDAKGTVWILEFATFAQDASCFTGMGYQANTGRLSRLTDDGTLATVVDNLDFPGAILPMPDGSIYVTEIFAGRILHIQFDVELEAKTNTPNITRPVPTYIQIDDIDQALREVITRNQLTAYPGQDLIEGDTEIARLGRDLFFDPILSGDMNISCATCHHPEFAMADGRVLPIGVGGVGLGEIRQFAPTTTIQVDSRDENRGEIPNPFIGQFVPRNSPTVINGALLSAQFWDGRVESYALGELVHTLENEVNILGLTDALATQALFPVTSMHEMAGATFGEDSPQYIRDMLVQRLNNNADYVAQFERVFGIVDIEPIHIVSAIAAFERQFIFTDSAWDNYIAGDVNALTNEQKRGALLFYGVLNSNVNCATCHSGDMLTDLNYYNLLVPQIGPGKGNGNKRREDYGRANVTFDYRDQYRFRTPSLRNVDLTAPYLHSGAYQTLEDVVWHHADLWRSNVTYDPASNLPSPYYSSLLPFVSERQAHSVASQLENGLSLTEQDVLDLVAFMQSLTDPTAEDLSHIAPSQVPSGLPLDPIPIDQFTINEQGTSAAISHNIEDNAPTSDWHFENVAQDIGLYFRHGAFVENLYQDPVAMMGGGLCWLDYDKDGWLDLYLVNSYAEDEIDYWLDNGGLPTNALYRNEQGQFADVSGQTGTELSMRGNGCVAADLNNDGWTDIYITADGANALLYNNGDGTFTEGALEAGIMASEWNSAIAVADLNADGWLDLFVGSYIDLANKVPSPVGAFPQDYFGIPDRLFLNQGADVDGRVTFTEISREAGLQIDERTLGAVFTDADNDSDLDLYIANDGHPNRLYLYETAMNALGFRFVDTYDTSNVNDRGSGMGVASGDWDADGWSDLMVTNWDVELNSIYRNQTDEHEYPYFEYSTFRIGMRGLGNNMTGWGVHFADFDHDTDLDLVTVNGRVPITNPETDAELVRFYSNRLMDGKPGEFRDWTQSVGFTNVGTLMARGSAVADYDNDGDLDIAINQISGDVVLLENIAPPGTWLMIDTEGFLPGTVVKIHLPNGQQLMREVHIGSSYLASEDPRLHFGLGDHTSVVRVEVISPEGRIFSVESQVANQQIKLTTDE